MQRNKAHVCARARVCVVGERVARECTLAGVRAYWWGGEGRGGSR